MAEEQIHLMNAQDQVSQYLHRIDQATASTEPDEMRQHIQEAMSFGRNALDGLDEALEVTEDADTADRIEEGMHHMDVSMDQGDQALEASDEDAMDFIIEMRKHAQQSIDFLAEAIGAAM